MKVVVTGYWIKMQSECAFYIIHVSLLTVGESSLFQRPFYFHLCQRPPYYHQSNQPEPQQCPERFQHQRARLHEEHRSPASVPKQQRPEHSQKALHGDAH